MNQSGLLIGTLVVSAGLAAWYHMSADDGRPSRPEVVIDADPALLVFDLLDPPEMAVVVTGQDTLDLPEHPRRYLVAQLDGGTVHLGWSSQPDQPPEERISVPVQGNRLAGYVDLHQPGQAVLEVWKGYRVETDRTSFVITITGGGP